MAQVATFSRRVSRRLSRGFQLLKRRVVTSDKDDNDLDQQVTRYKPDALESLCRSTKFNRKELKIMYRGFKQECPSGIVDEDTFKHIYAQFFPQGDTGAYAHYVFNAFDQDHNGTINFEEFVHGLSVLVRGSLEEKLQWTFSLYDINGDGVISLDEMVSIVTAIYAMMGRCTEPIIDTSTPRQHAESVFRKMDLDRDGVVSINDFMETCSKDEKITRSIVMFDTVL